jgi:signal transduction histidine kinase
MNAIASLGAQAKHFATSPVVKAVAITLGVYFLLMATQILPMFGITSRPDFAFRSEPDSGIIFVLLSPELQSASCMTHFILGPLLCILLMLRACEKSKVSRKLEPVVIGVLVASFVSLWLIVWERASPTWIDVNSIWQVLSVQAIFMISTLGWLIVWRGEYFTPKTIMIVVCYRLLTLLEMSFWVCVPPLVSGTATPIQAIEFFSRHLSIGFSLAGILFLAIGVCASAPRENMNPRTALLASSLAVLWAVYEQFFIFAGMHSNVYFSLLNLSDHILWALSLGVIYIFHAASQASRERRSQEIQNLVNIEASYAEARALTLSAQIEPHFLFNTLAHVLRLKNTNHKKGKLLLSSLIGYFEAALPRLRSEKTTLQDELVLVEAYLSILQQRMNERLSFSIDVPEDAREYPFPRMMLLTLVENAYKHGLMPLPLGGSIFISARRLGEFLHVEVADTGRGFNDQTTGGTGVGLANIRARLKTSFGDRASLELKLRDPHGISAVLIIPILTSD